MTIQQGKGHGTKIINDIVETKKNEYDLIYCFVDADNAGAIRLYKKLGTVYDEDGPNDNGQYYVTFYDNGKFDLDEDYDPPYNEEQIKANYGDETYQRLIDDPAHAWRMKTGLELIHKEPSKTELERIWANWQEMTDEQKAESDKKSIELFGKTNEENYNELIKLYESVEKEVEKFQSGESQLLFIAGLSASGKTTLAYELGTKYSAEVVNLDKFDIKYNTDNYIKSKNIPNIIEQFTNEVGIIEQGDTNIEKFMSWIVEQELDQPVIVEGVQLLSFPETIKDFPIIVLDLPIETLIKQQLDRNDGDWETIIINDAQFDNYEDWEAALSDSYKEEQEKLNDFIAKVNNQKFTLNESDTNEPELYCISQEDLDGQTLEPRVPDNFFTKNGYEDGETPRVCFTPSVDKCLMAISQKCEGIEFYVFSPEEVSDENIYKPTIEEVPDSEITDETWITCPVKLKKVGKIKVLGDSGLDGHPFNYGDKTAELYDWDWEWLEQSV
jgi:adenylate kinase family enzyme